jgi:hypothetical protein
MRRGLAADAVSPWQNRHGCALCLLRLLVIGIGVQIVIVRVTAVASWCSVSGCDVGPSMTG